MAAILDNSSLGTMSSEFASKLLGANKIQKGIFMHCDDHHATTTDRRPASFIASSLMVTPSPLSSSSL